MKVKPGILLGIFTIIILVLAGVLSSGNRQIASPQSSTLEYSNPPLPQIDGPFPNAEEVSLEQAEASISYPMPLPVSIEIKQVWVSTNLERSENSFAVEFNTDLLLIVHETAKQPDWDGIIVTTPELTKISVNGNPGVGTGPGFTKYGDRKYPYPGSVGWWVDGLNITLYSDTLSLEELLKIAETVR